MEDSKSQLSARLKSASNVLVTVNSNPTVDQLAAAIGLTLLLNKMGKHATAVFSGQVPPTIEFLKPEKTLEKNADSLRDFIISLDKSKADKLRYKIEENYVRIFITPYHTSIGDKDLIFSQGDYNVDVVVGLGVHQREELDKAITAHGRILHDATITTINTEVASTLGSINWAERSASSLCEMLVALSDTLQPSNLIDIQIANALLTGIVAETQRFSNPKTTASTMNAGSKLLSAGANQQLVAEKLQPVPPPLVVQKDEDETPPPPPPEPKPTVVEQSVPKQDETPPPLAKPEPKPPEPVKEAGEPKEKEASPPTAGLLQVEHEAPKKTYDRMPTVMDTGPDSGLAQVNIDEQGNLKTVNKDKPVQSPTINVNGQSVLVSAPANVAVPGAQGQNGQINSVGESDDQPDVDPFDDHSHDEKPPETPQEMPLLSHEDKPDSPPAPVPGQPVAPPPIDTSQTGQNSDLDAFRSAVDEAIASHPDPDHLGARQDQGSTSLGEVQNHTSPPPQTPTPSASSSPATISPPPVPPPLPNIPVNNGNGSNNQNPI
ncbi:MAG TPA: hypothetical protein VMR34_04385 [Candidatus Saccharimonadales bacterium]|nr:hypothetical protein [Candidatus Saccharimonadales bacterium]